MAVKDVTNLRRAGKYKEALSLALRELDEDSNEWTKMSLFWVYRDIVQNILIPGNDISEAQKLLDKMEDLLPDMMDDNGSGERAYAGLLKKILPESDTLASITALSKSDPDAAYRQVVEKYGHSGENLNVKFHEDYGWIIYRYVKSNISTLNSLEVRKLLRDYMFLKNERPSMLHSMILNFALNFAKTNTDFNFYNFFKLWGIENLRFEDFRDGSVEDHEIPSLISRILKIFVDSSVNQDLTDLLQQLDSFHNIKSDLSFMDLVEYLRQPAFWKIMNCHKESGLENLWHQFSIYVNQYAQYGASYWNSEVLKIACRFMDDDNAWRFLPFFQKWNYENLREDDWKEEITKDGTVYPSLGVKSAKKCFNILKTRLEHVDDSSSDLEWLRSFYKIVIEHQPDDEWIHRNYATICCWCKDVDEAISKYKDLLVGLGDKYYVWYELAQCINDNNYLKTGLLLKAKQLEKNEDFLGDIHLALAECLIQDGNKSAAKKELETYEKHRLQKNWNLSEKYNSLMQHLTEMDNQHKRFDFLKCKYEAEDFVYNQFEWKNFVITEKWVTDNVEKCSLFDGKNFSFQVKCKNFKCLSTAKPGDIVSFRYSFAEEKHFRTVQNSYQHNQSAEKKIIPLMVKLSDEKVWSILPFKYGAIDYINTESKVIHILNQDSKLIFYKYKTLDFRQGDFVRYQVFDKKYKNEKRESIATINSCSKEEVLPFMKSGVAVVDDVNVKKQLFHVVLGPDLSDIVRFDQTALRPRIGDALRVTYCIK